MSEREVEIGEGDRVLFIWYFFVFKQGFDGYSVKISVYLKIFSFFFQKYLRISLNIDIF